MALLFDAFSTQISLRDLRKLDCYTNRYPPRIKSGAGVRSKTLRYLTSFSETAARPLWP
jgi:hypothetical protein